MWCIQFVRSVMQCLCCNSVVVVVVVVVGGGVVLAHGSFFGVGLTVFLFGTCQILLLILPCCAQYWLVCATTSRLYEAFLSFLCAHLAQSTLVCHWSPREAPAQKTTTARQHILLLDV
jgi:hypothetical protein